MKEYPSISNMIQTGLPVYAFNKIDGSNIRAEWSSKKGFYKFGSRKRLLGSDQEGIFEAQNLILEQEEHVARICKKNRWQRIILFYEFAGPNSAFGQHIDEEHQVYLIDANPFKKGILPPKLFIEHFQDLNPAQCLYRGNCNSSFVNSVIDGTLPGMSSEGVVCKAKGRGNDIIRFKIKTKAWYDRLREYCNGNDELFERLK